MNRFFTNRQSDFASEEGVSRFAKRRTAMQALEEEMGPAAASTRFAKVNRDLWGPAIPAPSTKKRGFKGGS